MEKREEIGGNALFNTAGFVFPFLLVGIHLVILQTLYNTSNSHFSLLLTTFGLFWPLFVIGGALNIKKLPPKWQIAAQCAVLSSVLAGFGFYVFAPTIMSISCY